MKLFVAGLILGGSLCAAGAGFCQTNLPPGGSAWVRSPIKAAGQPRGYVEFEKYCSGCHAEGPEKRDGTEALRAKYEGAKPALLSERQDLTAVFVKLTVRQGVSIMPPSRKTEVSDSDLDAIAAYLTRNKQQ
jgi:mono/diheme cytochrome c family protein